MGSLSILLLVYLKFEIIPRDKKKIEIIKIDGNFLSFKKYDLKCKDLSISELFVISALHKNRVARNKADIVIGIPVEFSLV